MCKVRRRSPRSSSSSAASRTILLTRPLLEACAVVGALTPLPPGAETPISGSAGDVEPQHHLGATSGIRNAIMKGKRVESSGNEIFVLSSANELLIHCFVCYLGLFWLMNSDIADLPVNTVSPGLDSSAHHERSPLAKLAAPWCPRHIASLTHRSPSVPFRPCAFLVMSSFSFSSMRRLFNNSFTKTKVQVAY